MNGRKNFMDIANSDELKRFTDHAQQAIVFEADFQAGRGFDGQGNSAIAFLATTRVSPDQVRAGGAIEAGLTDVGESLLSPQGDRMSPRDLSALIAKQRFSTSSAGYPTMIFTVMEELCRVVPKRKKITRRDYAAGLYLFGDNSLRSLYKHNQARFMGFVGSDSVPHDHPVGALAVR